ncbi:hypothetical protein D5086_018918 [Populus alba]|uniref:Uncharacterized protein n=1 Tax=Populus alba TaxID=43335 RepID=A0ACC4BR28_POPAL
MESRREMGWRQLQRVGTLRDSKVEKSVSLWPEKLPNYWFRKTNAPSMVKLLLKSQSACQYELLTNMYENTHEGEGEGEELSSLGSHKTEASGEELLSELVVLFSHIIGNHSLNSRINALRYEYGVIDFGELIERQQPPKRLQFALVQPPPPNKSNNNREMAAFLLYDHINLVKAQPMTPCISVKSIQSSIIQVFGLGQAYTRKKQRKGVLVAEISSHRKLPIISPEPCRIFKYIIIAINRVRSVFRMI